MSNLRSDIRFVAILGTRGIPAAHGGFETFAEGLALYLQQNGWKVIVYCQGREGKISKSRTDLWKSIERVNIDTVTSGTLATMEFDLRSVFHSLRFDCTCLVLGYNTAVFNVLHKLFRRFLVINMDGIEWKRNKWSKTAAAWFWANEWIGGKIANKVIADHPEISRHLRSRGCRDPIMIPYGADKVQDNIHSVLEKYNLKLHSYFLVVARLEPENSIKEIVEAFGKTSGSTKLVVLGNLSQSNIYHNKIKESACDRVHFLGAIYEKNSVQTLRLNCLSYVHGHTVGGTNPSLVEALAAGCPIIAEDNVYNRWTAGSGQLYFDSVESCTTAMQKLIDDPSTRAKMVEASQCRHSAEFTYPRIYQEYEKVLLARRTRK